MIRPSVSSRKPDPVDPPTWIITVPGSTRLAISTVLAWAGGAGSGCARSLAPGSGGGGAEDTVGGGTDTSPSVASRDPPYPAAPPISRAVRADTATTVPVRGRGRAGPGGAAVSQGGPCGGGGMAVREAEGGPVGGAQLSDRCSNAGPRGASARQSPSSSGVVSSAESASPARSARSAGGCPWGAENGSSGAGPPAPPPGGGVFSPNDLALHVGQQLRPALSDAAHRSALRHRIVGQGGDRPGEQGRRAVGRDREHRVAGLPGRQPRRALPRVGPQPRVPARAA